MKQIFQFAIVGLFVGYIFTNNKNKHNRYLKATLVIQRNWRRRVKERYYWRRYLASTSIQIAWRRYLTFNLLETDWVRYLASTSIQHAWKVYLTKKRHAASTSIQNAWRKYLEGAYKPIMISWKNKKEDWFLIDV